MGDQQRAGAETQGQKIPKRDITPDEDSIFRVQSQSDPNLTYRVDIEAYDCSCPAFPLIRYCKHICAVQAHFPEDVKILPITALAIPFHLPNDEHSEVEEDDSDTTDDIPGAYIITHSDSDTFPDINVIGNVQQKLQSLSTRFLLDPPASASTALHAFSAALDDFIGSLHPSSCGVLPPKKKIAPNQHSWSETAAVMGVPVKSKKRKHLDPYSGGERAGKKAKNDARAPLETLKCVLHYSTFRSY